MVYSEFVMHIIAKYIRKNSYVFNSNMNFLTLSYFNNINVFRLIGLGVAIIISGELQFIDAKFITLNIG